MGKGVITSVNEPFFVIDTETIGLSDKGIVTNIAMVYVDMNKIICDNEAGYIVSPKEFLTYVKTLDIYPSIKQQKEMGRITTKSVVDFWGRQFAEAKKEGNIEYLKYIDKMLGKEDTKPDILYVINYIHNFIKEGVENSVDNVGIREKDIPFIERGGGFDTGKFYSLRDSVLMGYEVNDSIFIPHWSRRELRSILSTNRWRDISLFVKGTNWGKEFTEMVVDEINMVKHMAIFDALLDAYGIYCLKVTEKHFYL